MRDRSGTRTVIPRGTTTGYAVGDILYSHIVSSFPALGAGTGTIYLNVAPIHGQANPHGGGQLGNGFNLHRISYLDTTPDNEAYDTGEIIYDPSYDHSTGNARTGWASLHAYEEDANVEYIYPCRITVHSVNASGGIITCTRSIGSFTVANTTTGTEIEIYTGWPRPPGP